MMQSINPFDNKLLNTFEEFTSEKIDSIIHESYQAFLGWKETDLSYRSELLFNVAKRLKARREADARLMTMEMGKPISQSLAEVDKCAFLSEYYANNGAEFLKDKYIEADSSSSYISFQPLGIILGVMPWNFPYWQVFRFALPTLLAGNVCLLKHAPNVTGCALAIEKIFEESGFPKNIFRTLVIETNLVENILSNDHVKAVSLTGGTKAGKSIASLAGKYLKKSLLELGGSDPYIILEDADLESAVKNSIFSRLINSGQSCIAAKRFIIVKNVYEKFENIFVDEMKKVVMGNPLDEKTTLGPQARIDLRDQLHKQVIDSIHAGAELILGGEIPNLEGAFYPPTILRNVKKGMPAYDDEMFGPVAALIIAEDEDDAIRIANDSVYGLGAAVFTENLEKGNLIARTKLNAGLCFVNTFVKSDPRLPFGGINQSGYGRELSEFGLHEFVNLKTVVIK